MTRTVPSFSPLCLSLQERVDGKLLEEYAQCLLQQLWAVSKLKRYKGFVVKKAGIGI